MASIEVEEAEERARMQAERAAEGRDPNEDTRQYASSEQQSSGPEKYDYKSGDTNTGNPWVDGMINRDQGSWEGTLKQYAASKGVTYDPSDLQDVIRNVSYKQNAGKDPLEFIKAGMKKYDERAAPTGSRQFDSQGPMYDQRTNQLSAAGQAATQALASRQNPAFAPGPPIPGFREAGGAGRNQFSFNAPGSQFGNDPYSQLLEDIAKQQMAALQQPQSNPQLDKFLQFLDAQFNDKANNPGYSPEELALLRTQALDPIEADRAASQRRVLERTASRGMLPSSGLTELDSQFADREYDKLRGAAQRDLGINAIGRRDQNLAQAMTLGQLAGIQIPQMQRQEDQGRRAELLNVGNLLYQMPRQALMDSLAVVNGSPAPPDLFNQAVQLLNSNQNQQALNDQRNQQFWAQLGELFGNLF